ncbi:MAG: hypothetical protein AAB736_02085 [Patescibacteria group bacterium]
MLCPSEALSEGGKTGIPPLSDSNWIPAGVYPREDGGGNDRENIRWSIEA